MACGTRGPDHNLINIMQGFFSDDTIACELKTSHDIVAEEYQLCVPDLLPLKVGDLVTQEVE
jgi:hypothetical protein